MPRSAVAEKQLAVCRKAIKGAYGLTHGCGSKDIEANVMRAARDALATCAPQEREELANGRVPARFTQQYLTDIFDSPPVRQPRVPTVARRHWSSVAYDAFCKLYKDAIKSDVAAAVEASGSRVRNKEKLGRRIGWKKFQCLSAAERRSFLPPSTAEAVAAQEQLALQASRERKLERERARKRARVEVQEELQRTPKKPNIFSDECMLQDMLVTPEKMPGSGKAAATKRLASLGQSFIEVTKSCASGEWRNRRWHWLARCCLLGQYEARQTRSTCGGRFLDPCGGRLSTSAAGDLGAPLSPMPLL